MKNLNPNSQNFKGFQPLSRAEMKKVSGGVVDPAPCDGTVCPAGTALVVRQISEGVYECTCQCGDASYCY